MVQQIFITVSAGIEQLPFESDEGSPKQFRVFEARIGIQ